MTREEFTTMLERRFGELGDPTDQTGTAVCPLGLAYDDPSDLNPEPQAVADKTGLPVSYCIGVAEGWDNAYGFYSGNQADRHLRWAGNAAGRRARDRWFKAHPRTL